MEKISSLRDEAVRLICLQKDMLLEIKEKIPAQSVPRHSGADEASNFTSGQFTPEAIDRKISALDENLIKVQNLDMVLAVVGTMKAGKSTCINAIVGREILPNRNRPMTALPTLIRHISGVSDPRLLFGEQQQQPINLLVNSLQKKLSKVEVEVEVPRGIAGDADLVALARNVKAGFKLETRYEGEAGIFQFLKNLNDLVRLAKALAVPFPFDKYNSVADFPVIEVEFFHLKQAGENTALGSFALLDTPGFNEAGQSQYLLPMLQTQLEKATAVLAVLDYTQLKSESEAQLREELENIAHHSGDRMFAVVNKFDAKDSNSDDAEATKKYVVKNLLSKVFAERRDLSDRIFPVSAQIAFLAKRAELEIVEMGEVTWALGDKETWIDTFGSKAFGVRFPKFIGDREAVLEACDELWKQSLFSEPLTHAIAYSYNNAAKFAIQAAISKLSEIALGRDASGTQDGIGAMLNLRQQGLDASMGGLSKLVDELDSNLKRLGKKEQQASNDLDRIISNSHDGVAKELNRQTKEVLDTVERLLIGSGTFTHSDGSKSSNSVSQLFWSISKSLGGISKNSPSLPNRKVDQSDGDEVMTFKSESEAKEKLNEIAQLLQKYLENAADKIASDLASTVDDFVVALEALKEAITVEAEEFSTHAELVGFQGLKIKIPHFKVTKITADIDDTTGELIKDKSHVVTRRREQSGGWGWLKRKADFFDADWGIDTYEDKVQKFEFSKKDLLAHYKRFVKKYTDQLKKTVQSDFSSPLEAAKNNFFEKIEQAFSDVRESMMASRLDQEQSKEEQKLIKTVLEKLQQTFDDSIVDIRQLKRNAEKMAKAGGA